MFLISPKRVTIMLKYFNGKGDNLKRLGIPVRPMDREDELWLIHDWDLYAEDMEDFVTLSEICFRSLAVEDIEAELEIMHEVEEAGSELSER